MRGLFIYCTKVFLFPPHLARSGCCTCWAVWDWISCFRTHYEGGQTSPNNLGMHTFFDSPLSFGPLRFLQCTNVGGAYIIFIATSCIPHSLMP